MQQLLTARGVAGMLGISGAKVCQLKGEIGYHRIGGAVRFRAEDAGRYVDSCQAGARLISQGKTKGVIVGDFGPVSDLTVVLRDVSSRTAFWDCRPVTTSGITADPSRRMLVKRQSDATPCCVDAQLPAARYCRRKVYRPLACAIVCCGHKGIGDDSS